MPNTKLAKHRKTNSINARVTDDQKSRIKAKANALGLTVSKYIEKLIANDATVGIISTLDERRLERRLNTPEGCLADARKIINAAVAVFADPVDRDLEWVMRTTMLAEALAQLDPDGEMWYPCPDPGVANIWSTAEIIQTVFPPKRNILNFIRDSIRPEDLDDASQVAKLGEPKPVKKPQRPQAPKADAVVTKPAEIPDSDGFMRKLVTSSDPEPARTLPDLYHRGRTEGGYKTETYSCYR